MEWDINLAGSNNIKTLSIKTKFFMSFSLFTLLIVLAFTVLANYFIFLSFHKSAELERQSIIDDIIANVEKASTGSIDYAQLDIVGKQALEVGMTITLNDSASNMIYCIEDESGKTKKQLLSSFNQYIPALFNKSSPDILTKTIAINDEQRLILSHYKPLYYNDLQRELMKKLNILVFCLSLVFLMFSFILAKNISKKFFKPITEITHQAKDMINSYDLQSIAQSSGIKEIHDLIYSFNELSIGLYTEKIKRKRLLSSYAHEVRTPLQAISSSIEGMSDGIIVASPKNMRGLYSELLRLSKLLENIEQIFDIDENQLHKTQIDVFKLIKQAILLHEIDIKKKNIKIIFKSENTFAFGDEDKIYRVILNLVSNTIKYTDAGGKVDINVSQGYGKTTISLKNECTPLDEQEAEYIFDYLYRSKNAKNYVGGLGIGLAIVKAIITAHGGKVSAKPIAGFGNEVIIVF